MIAKTHEYIINSWEKAIIAPENAETPSLYVKPFVPPCINGPFKVLFYWDTYFTNKGLIADGRAEEAKNNTENLLNSVENFGFVPNAISEHLSKFCSQPPYLHFIVNDVYAAFGDEKWLEKAYFTLKKEYAFWQTERAGYDGLNRHFHHKLPENELLDYYGYVAGERLNLSEQKTKEEKLSLSENFIAVAESGMDWTPRFGFEGASFLPVDLNANLYGAEQDLFEWSKKFEPCKTETFSRALKLRKEKTEKYMAGDDGLFHDYNFVSEKKTELYSSSMFMPFVVGLCDDKNAFNRLIDRLFKPYGVICVEKTRQNTVYQWGYPNSWAPDNFLAYAAAKAVGENEKAELIAKTYLNTVAGEFVKSGRLWEKYDGEKGGAATVNEYDVPEMLGWTAGVFEYFYKELGL